MLYCFNSILKINIAKSSSVINLLKKVEAAGGPLDIFKSASTQPPTQPLCSRWSILFPLLLHREEQLIQALLLQKLFSPSIQKKYNSKTSFSNNFRNESREAAMRNMTSEERLRICWQNCKKIVRHDEYKNAKYYRDANFSLLALTKLLGTH